MQIQPQRQLVLLQLLLLLLSCSCSLSLAEYCKPVNTTENAPLPYIPVSYQTRIEMNIVNKNKTLEIEEYVDGDSGDMRIKMFQKNGQIDDFIFRNSTGEIFVIVNNIDCQVINMSSMTDLNLLFGINGKLVASSKQVLRFAKEFGLEYRNQTTIRGIAVDHWYSCQKWAERKAEFTVDWYFSARDWSTPYNRNLPVRAEVKGVAGVTGNTHDFHIIYDFMFFRSTIMVSYDIFDTPRGLYCKNRMSQKPPPKLPPVLSYSQELLVHNPELEVVQYSNVLYDGEQFLVKYQFRDADSANMGPFYNKGSMTVVQDFKTGVSYFIDDLLGNCTDQPIGKAAFDLDDAPIKGKPGWYIVELRSPMALFRIDDSYQFTGKRISRGVPVERYISLRSDYPIQGRPDLNFTFEYEMLDPEVTEIILGKNKVNTGKNVPVMLRISNYRKLDDIIDPTFDYREEYNFYNFDKQNMANPSEDFDKIQAYDLDVSSCYDKSERKNVMIRFMNLDVYENYIKDEPNLFIRRAAQVLAKAELGLVNPLRFQQIRIDHDPTFIYLIFTLLDAPHPYAQFHKLTAANSYIENADITANVASELQCLQQCNKQLSPACNSMAYCPNSKTGSNCLMSSSFRRNTTNPDSEHPCSVFMRPVSVLQPDALELSLESAFTELVQYVESGLFLVPMESPNADGNGLPKVTNVTAVDIEQFDVRPNVDAATSGRHLFKFKVTPGAALKVISRSVQGDLSIDDCADACLGSDDINCRAFTFCYGIAACFLHNVSGSEQPGMVQKRLRCNLYDKNNLATFEKEPGVARVQSAEHSLLEVGSAGECADNCLETQSCRSFDYCDIGDDVKKFCYLSKAHKIDSGGEVNLIINCTHYSRAYTTDFSQEHKVTDPDLSQFAAVLSDLNLDACSRSCAEQYGESCNGFYHCAADAKQQALCAIWQPGLPKFVASNGAAAPDCVFYSRTYDSDGSPWINRNTDKIIGNRFGVSALNVIVVGCVLLLLGLLLGVGAVLGFMKMRNNPAQIDEPNVQYSVQ